MQSLKLMANVADIWPFLSLDYILGHENPSHGDVKDFNHCSMLNYKGHSLYMSFAHFTWMKYMT